MISASKTTFSHFNLKILRPKVMKNIKNLREKFCELRLWVFGIILVGGQHITQKLYRLSLDFFGPKVKIIFYQ